MKRAFPVRGRLLPASFLAATRRAPNGGALSGPAFATTTSRGRFSQRSGSTEFDFRRQGALRVPGHIFPLASHINLRLDANPISFTFMHHESECEPVFIIWRQP
jgi:hypothetical protein